MGFYSRGTNLSDTNAEDIPVQFNRQYLLLAQSQIILQGATGLSMSKANMGYSPGFIVRCILPKLEITTDTHVQIQFGGLQIISIGGSSPLE